MKLNIFFQEFNYRTIEESAANNVSLGAPDSSALHPEGQEDPQPHRRIRKASNTNCFPGLRWSPFPFPVNNTPHRKPGGWASGSNW